MTIQFETTTTDVAIQCFLNAFMRETRDWQIVPTADIQQHTQVHIPLSHSQTIRIALQHISPTQHHQYIFPARLHEQDDGKGVALSVEQLVTLLLEKPAVRGELTDEVIARFRQRVLESHDNTHNAINIRLEWPMLRDKPLNFAQAEQGLLVGHAFHPAPKSREPFDKQQARRYLPDFAAQFPLRWFAVDKRYVCGDSLVLTLQQRLQRFVTESAPQLLKHFTDNVWLVPMHPWQADHLLAQAWCRQLIAQQRMRDLGEAGERWLPTSSSRSLYNASSHDMIKFSLNVRLTNSIRTLSVKEVKRGMRLARLAQTPRWQELQACYPTMRIMQEDGWVGLHSVNGVIQEDSLMTFRDNLLFSLPESQTNVLVTLTQAALDGGDSLLAATVRRLAERLKLPEQCAAHCWLDAYCNHVLLPLFSIEANYGLVLLAHQQNILVEMQQDLPIGMLYRDCQGSGFTRNAMPWLEEIGEADAENLFSEQQLLRYFPYYLLVNSTLAVTAAMAAAGFDSEENLMAKVRDLLSRLRTITENTLCLDYVLDSTYWNCKGNFFCYLHDHNENTILDPAVIYFDFVNPLHESQGGRQSCSRPN